MDWCILSTILSFKTESSSSNNSSSNNNNNNNSNVKFVRRSQTRAADNMTTGAHRFTLIVMVSCRQRVAVGDRRWGLRVSSCAA